MNDLPTIEKLATSGSVTVTFAGTAGGAVTVEENTSDATVTPLSSLSARVDPAGPGDFGHVDLTCIDGNGELGRARVIFLIPVTFS